MRTRAIHLLLFVCGFFFSATALLVAAEPDVLQWPQFRGPDGQGHANQKVAPVHWSEEKNIVWKVAVPGEGFSSPVIGGSQIWLTTAEDGGKSLHAIVFDKTSGKLLHDIKVITTDNPGPRHKTNGYAVDVCRQTD